MEKNLIITIVLAVLVVISAAQAIQIGKMKATLVEEGLTMSGGSAVKAAQTGGGSGGEPALPNSLENLPGMVGGC